MSDTANSIKAMKLPPEMESGPRKAFWYGATAGLWLIFLARFFSSPDSHDVSDGWHSDAAREMTYTVFYPVTIVVRLLLGPLALAWLQAKLLAAAYRPLKDFKANLVVSDSFRLWLCLGFFYNALFLPLSSGLWEILWRVSHSIVFNDVSRGLLEVVLFLGAGPLILFAHPLLRGPCTKFARKFCPHFLTLLGR